MNMIFHYPYPLIPEGHSGSQVRPYKMARAFEAIGYNVHQVTGYAAERKNAIKKIKNSVKNGKKYDFIYSESSTMPTLLTERHHFPTHPFLDFGFLKWAKINSIPVGLFYRDIHWKFGQYTNEVPWFKRVISIQMYKYDLLQYSYLLDHLFLPSMKMCEALPWKCGFTISALPPGCDILNHDKQSGGNENFLELFYVGGVIPPNYDLHPLFEIIKKMNTARLTICCRKNEWERTSKYYSAIPTKRLNIVHESGSEIQKYYYKADLFALLRYPNEYVDFAMPVKVFESISHGVPILTIEGTEVARFIKQEGIGWVVQNIDEAVDLLRYLQNHRKEIDSMKRIVSRVRLGHTWEERARQVALTLKK